MNKYKYTGPVYLFNKLIHPNWTGYTSAPSPAKALSNLAFQYKRKFGFMPNAKISLNVNSLNAI